MKITNQQEWAKAIGQVVGLLAECNKFHLSQCTEVPEGLTQDVAKLSDVCEENADACGLFEMVAEKMQEPEPADVEKFNAAHDAWVVATARYFVMLEEYNTPTEEQTDAWRAGFDHTYVIDRLSETDSDGEIAAEMQTLWNKCW
jgi:hypothetical protein